MSHQLCLHISRKLESEPEPEPGIEPRYFHMGQRHLNHCLNHSVKPQPQLLLVMWADPLTATVLGLRKPPVLALPCPLPGAFPRHRREVDTNGVTSGLAQDPPPEVRGAADLRPAPAHPEGQDSHREDLLPEAPRKAPRGRVPVLDPPGENPAERSVHHHQRPKNPVHPLPSAQEAQQLPGSNSKWGPPAASRRGRNTHTRVCRHQCTYVHTCAHALDLGVNQPQSEILFRGPAP